jgi:hypothetical protein
LEVRKDAKPLFVQIARGWLYAPFGTSHNVAVVHPVNWQCSIQESALGAAGGGGYLSAAGRGGATGAWQLTTARCAGP